MSYWVIILIVAVIAGVVKFLHITMEETENETARTFSFIGLCLLAHWSFSFISKDAMIKWKEIIKKDRKEWRKTVEKWNYREKNSLKTMMHQRQKDITIVWLPLIRQERNSRLISCSRVSLQNINTAV